MKLVPFNWTVLLMLKKCIKLRMQEDTQKGHQQTKIIIKMYQQDHTTNPIKIFILQKQTGSTKGNLSRFGSEIINGYRNHCRYVCKKIFICKFEISLKTCHRKKATLSFWQTSLQNLRHPKSTVSDSLEIYTELLIHDRKGQLSDSLWSVRQLTKSMHFTQLVMNYISPRKHCVWNGSQKQPAGTTRILFCNPQLIRTTL